MMSEKSNRTFFGICVILILLLVPVSQVIPLNLPSLPSASAQSTISINNVQTTHTTTASSTITLSNFNAGAGGNRTLVVAVQADNKSVNSITFGGKSLTQASGSFHN